MHDFRKFVAAGRKQDPREREVVSELAAHLEEMYSDLRRAGASEEQAIAQVASAGRNLGPAVRRLRWQQQGGLRTWLRAAVLPGLIVAFVYGVCRALLVDAYWEHSFVWREAILALIAVALGFCASLFSRENGGDLSHRRWAGAFVIVPYAAVWCVMAFLVTPIQWFHGAQFHRPGMITGVASSLAWILLWDVVIPAAGLAVGGAISVHAFSPAPTDLPKREIA